VFGLEPAAIVIDRIGNADGGGVRGEKQGRQQQWESSGQGGRDRVDLTRKEVDAGGVGKDGCFVDWEASNSKF